MPIIQVRPTLDSQWLIASFPPVPRPSAVVEEWKKPSWRSELLVYPGGYVGDVSPIAWRSISSYVLQVANDGEQANMFAMSTVPEQKTLDELMAELQGATPEEIQAIGSLATINSEDKSTFITMGLSSNRWAIGGIVMHATAAELTGLRGIFPETPVQTT